MSQHCDSAGVDPSESPPPDHRDVGHLRGPGEEALHLGELRDELRESIREDLREARAPLFADCVELSPVAVEGHHSGAVLLLLVAIAHLLELLFSFVMLLLLTVITYSCYCVLFNYCIVYVFVCLSRTFSNSCLVIIMPSVIMRTESTSSV